MKLPDLLKMPTFNRIGAEEHKETKVGYRFLNRSTDT